MPHTSHRKKAQQHRKRTEVVDEDGWTRVTTANSTKGTFSLAQNQFPDAGENKPEQLPWHNTSSISKTHYISSTLAEGITLEKLQTTFRQVQNRWHATSSYAALEKIMRDKIDTNILLDIDVCVLFGSGSFCGLVQGWIERFEVSLFQLSAFVSVIDTIAQITGRRPTAYAQEPIYNDLDAQLLNYLGITKVDDPTGFQALTRKSLVYAPNAELDVTMRTLVAAPAIAIQTGKLDRYWRNEKGDACTDRSLISTDNGLLPFHQLTDTEKDANRDIICQDDIERGLEIQETFKMDRDIFSLPDLDIKDYPFSSVYVYSRRSDHNDQEAKTG